MYIHTHTYICMYVYTTESLCRIPKTNTTLYISYTSVEK